MALQEIPTFSQLYQQTEARLRECELGFAPAKRIQESFVAAAEKRSLLWLAARTPAWINSDHLTLLGFAGNLAAGICYALARWEPQMLLGAVACLAANWLGDSLDGTLARVRNRQRPRYGFYVDHVIDTFSAFFLMGGLALSGYVHPDVAMGMLVAFLMLSVEVYLASYTLKTFRLSYAKFGPTEIRILLAVGSVALLFRPVVHILDRPYLLFDVGGVIAIAGMVSILIVSAICHTVQLYREEQPQ
ncbi:MAG TPA: CDP-alcohol phosphatidyltransferase family protein [Terriglobales bacterium]|nr:CDP-alcohol phosphatidyltransferase family protein [Terriglobales bacterium]